MRFGTLHTIAPIGQGSPHCLGLLGGLGLVLLLLLEVVVVVVVRLLLTQLLLLVMLQLL